MAHEEIIDHYKPSEELASYLNSIESSTYVHEFSNGIEIESAGRAPNKGTLIMLHDLKALPYLIASKNDIVVAPPMSQSFVDHLANSLGIIDLPLFVNSMEEAKTCDVITGFRPFGIAGDHMRRSHIAKYRNDVAVCTSLEEIDSAVLRLSRPKIVIKSEYSCGGQGVRWRWDLQTREWAVNRLRQDGCVTVEPFYDIISEVSGEFLYGLWNGISIVQVEHGIWRGQCLENAKKVMTPEVYDFVFREATIEKTLKNINVPKCCGMETCGMDVAIVRNEETNNLELVLLEVNARVNMAHYAIAAKRRVPHAVRFNVVRVTDLVGNPKLIPITDPSTAIMWCAVLEVS